MAKIKDIAKKMNLSVSTVYKAFNGAADINEETRKNIYKTAQEMGYIPVGSHLKAEMKRVCVFLSPKLYKNIDKILTNYRKRYKIGL